MKGRYTFEQVRDAMEQGGGRLKAAAALLGCSRVTVDSYLKKYPELRPVGNKGPDPRYSVEQVREALVEADGKQTAAASILGCSLNTMSNYIKRNPELRAVANGRTPKYSRDELLAALEASGGNQSQAARSLGCSLHTIWRFGKKHPDIRKEYMSSRATRMDLDLPVTMREYLEKEAERTGVVWNDLARPLVRKALERFADSPDMEAMLAGSEEA